jgi:inorganic pyrophosphatase
MTKTDFWNYLDILVQESRIVIDIPKGTTNNRFPEGPYSFNYGHLENTSSMDKEGIDIYTGSDSNRVINAIICTIDLMKRDSEIKILYGCNQKETNEIESIYNYFPSMKGMLVKR